MCTLPSLCKNYWKFVQIYPGNLVVYWSAGFRHLGPTPPTLLTVFLRINRTGKNNYFHVVRINGSKNNNYDIRCSNYFNNSSVMNYQRTRTVTIFSYASTQIRRHALPVRDLINIWRCTLIFKYVKVLLWTVNNSSMCLHHVMLTGRKLNALLFTFCTCRWAIHKVGS